MMNQTRTRAQAASMVAFADFFSNSYFQSCAKLLSPDVLKQFQSLSSHFSPSDRTAVGTQHVGSQISAWEKLASPDAQGDR
jgi:hypothetical protein